MNIFVGFGFNENDKWIKELVFPLIQAFDGTVETGEQLYAGGITQEVTNKILKADGVIGFLTRREALTSGLFTTHQWVRDELVTANSNKVPVMEVREKKVDPQSGILGHKQHIAFNQEDKAPLMVELASLLSAWRRNLRPRRFFLLPRDIVLDAKLYINKEPLKCTYQFMDGSRESEIYSAKPFKYGQGLCVDIRNVPSENSLVQITLKVDGQFEWSSGYESVQLLSINLEKN